MLANLLSREANMARFPLESLRRDIKEHETGTVSKFTKLRLPKNRQTCL